MQRGQLGADDDEAVSAVIGTILVLAITVLGIAGLMLWGGPTLERVQAQNAANAVQGEFEGLRDASQDLSVPDHSRFPTIALPAGELALVEGTRFLVASNHDPDYPSCDLHVTGWGGTAATNEVTVSTQGCRPLTSTNFDVSSVSGTTVTRLNASVSGAGPYTASATGVDFSKGDWVFRIIDTGVNPTPLAEAWLHSSDRITWALQSGSADRALYLEAGAIFERSASTIFLAKAPPINDASFGTGYYGLWLRTYAALGSSAIQAAGSHQVYLSLASNDLHVDNNTVDRLRYTFAGDLAEGWCNALLQRNSTLASASYEEDPDATCDVGDGQGLRSVSFEYSGGSRFQFRFLHARIQTSLVA